MLGHAAALGVTPASVLRADPIELALTVAALEHAAERELERDRRLARLVITELAQALKKR